MKKEKCAALVYVPELTPEDVFSQLVCHHADVVRARNAHRAKRQVERKHRCIASIVIVVSSLATGVTLLITSGAIHLL